MIGMNRVVILSALLAGVSLSVWAAELVVVIGESEIELTYPELNVDGRTIWGEVVPLGQNWLEGEKEKTTIAFDEDITVNGLRLSAGTYGVYVNPVSDDDWQVVFNSGRVSKSWRYDEDEDLIRLALRPETIAHQESFQLGIDVIEEETEKRERFFISKEEFKDYEDEEENDEPESPTRGRLYLQWETKRVTLNLQMLGERRGKGLNPELPDDVQDIWDVVERSVYGFASEDFDAFVEDFSDDFDTEFGDGGGKETLHQLLTNFASRGMTEDIGLNFEELEYELEGSQAVFEGIIAYTQFGERNFTFELEQRDGAWKITTFYDEE
jgi:hypothetical protein